MNASRGKMVHCSTRSRCLRDLQLLKSTGDPLDAEPRRARLRAERAQQADHRHPAAAVPDPHTGNTDYGDKVFTKNYILK